MFNLHVLKDLQGHESKEPSPKQPQLSQPSVLEKIEKRLGSLRQ